MRIGILKESSFEETRVALTPDGVYTLVEQGHQVFVEKDSGLQSRCTNEDYTKAGANIVYSSDEIFGRSEFVIKVAPFTTSEVEKLQEEQITLSFLQLAVGRKYLLDAFIKKKITSIAYELIEDSFGALPILNTMSEIAGNASVQIAARYLETNSHGISRGILLGGIAGVAPASVVIIGAGRVGRSAVNAALGLGAQVIILDRDLDKLREVHSLYGKRITTVALNPSTAKRGVRYADVLIGAVQIKGGKMPHVVTEEMVKLMKPGSVILDVSIDQGGCVETSHPTTISNPSYLFNNVIHFCVPNIPALVPRTASFGLKNASLEFISDIANLGIDGAITEHNGLAKGICSKNGYCTNEFYSEIFNYEYKRVHIFSKN